MLLTKHLKLLLIILMSLYNFEYKTKLFDKYNENQIGGGLYMILLTNNYKININSRKRETIIELWTLN